MHYGLNDEVTDVSIYVFTFSYLFWLIAVKMIKQTEVAQILYRSASAHEWLFVFCFLILSIYRDT